MDLVTMGETMAAFAPEEDGRLRYASSFRLRVAGAESNVAVGAARLGFSAGWISRVGADEFGQKILRELRADGVDVSAVAVDEDRRTGLLFKETRPGGETAVTYYRAGSAASALSLDGRAREQLRGARIVHLTGITPALGESCAQAVREAVSIAHESGAAVSFDPNIRRKLWGSRDFVSPLRSLAEQAEYVLLGREEAELLYGPLSPRELFGALARCGRLRALALKDGARGALVLSREELHEIPPFPCACVDPVGAGDAFDAGFLCASLEGLPLRDCGRWGAVLGAKATETRGDTDGYLSRRELEACLRRETEITR